MADWNAAFAARLAQTMTRLSGAYSPIDMLSATVGSFSRAIRLSKVPWKSPMAAAEAAGGLMGAVMLANAGSNLYSGAQDLMEGDYSGALMSLGTAAGWYYGGRMAMGAIGRAALSHTYPGARTSYMREAREEFIKNRGQAEYNRIRQEIAQEQARRRKVIRQKIRQARMRQHAQQTAQQTTQGQANPTPPPPPTAD